MGGPWAGVDVGAAKGFDLAVVDRARVLDAARLPTVQEVVDWLRARAPAVVAVDSPRVAAPDGARSRACERDLRRDVCGIRYTPDRSTIGSTKRGYYGWIVHGLELYSALDGAASWDVVECFPTASWTRWAGPRRGSRAAWTGRALGRLGLAGVRARPSQDLRDAIAAAVTARLYDDRATERYGEIVVPADASAVTRLRAASGR